MAPRPAFRVRPGRAPRGSAVLPGDKSVTHRALILGALADGETRVSTPNRGTDCRATARALRALGAEIEEDGGGYRVRGTGGRLRPPSLALDLENSGTGARLLAGVLAGRPFASTIDGDGSLRRRPMGRVVEPLRAMGAAIEGPEGGSFLPLTIRGRPLRGIAHRMEVASAQAKSAILLAGLGATGETTVTEPAPSRDHTERLLRHMGAPVVCSGASVTIRGGGSLRGTNIDVGADPSAAAFYIVAALLAPGGDVTVEGMLGNPTRTAFLDVLARMGADIARTEASGGGPEALVTVRARSSALRGGEVGGSEIPSLIDEIPILAVAGAASGGVFTVRDAAELRHKESDRIRTVTRMLEALGSEVDERADGFTVRGRPLHGARVSSGGDHRVAMAAVVAGLAARGETLVEDVSCVATSLPEFLSIFCDLGMNDTILEESA
jgi:3-phosphoshikimate 1-carboxyvinyltransferase